MVSTPLAPTVPDQPSMTPSQQGRWQAVLDLLTGVLTPGPRSVLVLADADSDAYSDASSDDAGSDADAGPSGLAGPGIGENFSDRLAEALRSAGAQCRRLSLPPPGARTGRPERGPQTVVVANGTDWLSQAPGESWDVVIRLRRRGAGSGVRANPAATGDADIVVDVHDPAWPVIRHIDESLADRDRWHQAETRAFFAVRAATWDVRFGNDLPAYARAVAELGLAPAMVAIDVGCGTGRALPALRSAVGPQGTVVGVDLTEEMLVACTEQGRAAYADLVLADARHLPMADASVDGVFAAGLIGHLPDVAPVLHELARVARPGAALALFHPSGRAALAARHGRALHDDEPLSPGPLRAALHRSGWSLVSYDDGVDRFLARATRTP